MSTTVSGWVPPVLLGLLGGEMAERHVQAPVWLGLIVGIVVGMFLGTLLGRARARMVKWPRWV